MKRSYIIGILILISLVYQSDVFCQNLSIGIESGVGFYRMKDLKDLNTTIFNGLPFEAKMISNYPAYIYYKPSFLIAISKFNIGIQSSFYSTGSRISSKDYSGEYLFDTRTSSIVPSIYADYLFYSFFGKYHLSFSSEFGIALSSLKLKEQLNVYDYEITNSSYDFSSLNYFFKPGFQIRYNLFPVILLELNAGYFVQFGKKTFETRKHELLNNGGKAIAPDWSGLHMGVSLFFRTRSED